MGFLLPVLQKSTRLGVSIVSQLHPWWSHPVNQAITYDVNQCWREDREFSPPRASSLTIWGIFGWMLWTTFCVINEAFKRKRRPSTHSQMRPIQSHLSSPNLYHAGFWWAGHLDMKIGATCSAPAASLIVRSEGSSTLLKIIEVAKPSCFCGYCLSMPTTIRN